MRCFVLLVCFPFFSFAQGKKGEKFFYWGYNRSAYSTSDIHFIGKGYDFTLAKVKAKDLPSPFDLKTYFAIDNFTIPQFNIRFGKFIKPNTALSIGWDHMKYVMNGGQSSTITGNITSEAIEAAQKFKGTYNQTPITITNDFLTFEHTDGYNYASVELDKYAQFWQSTNQAHSLHGLFGGGIGVVVPRSDIRLFKKGDNHFWNLAGYGASAKAGVRWNFSKRFFLQNDTKAGITRMFKVKTTGTTGDYATQNITFLENYLVLGYRFGLK